MPIFNLDCGANVAIANPDLVDIRDCVIGDETRIGPFVGIEAGSRVGARCQISSHAFLCAGVVIEDDVFIGTGVTFTKTRYPRVLSATDCRATAGADATGPVTLVKRGASIGSNATVVAGTVVGSGSLVGAGSVVTRDVPDRCIVAGVPARVIGYVRLRMKRREAYQRARTVLLDVQVRKGKVSRHH